MFAKCLPYSRLLMYSNLPSKEDVEESIGIEYLRTVGESQYSIHKVKLESEKVVYAFVTYVNDVVIDTWFVEKIPPKTDFLNITKGKTTYDDINEIDPFLLPLNKKEKLIESFHRFEDGTMMSITYKKVNGVLVVDDYLIEDDPAGIVKNLFPIDVNLIKAEKNT